MDQTDVMGCIPPENTLRFVHGRFRGEGAQEWANVTETSTDHIGNCGAGMTLQSCPSKGKGQLYSPPPSSW